MDGKPHAQMKWLKRFQERRIGGDRFRAEPAPMLRPMAIAKGGGHPSLRFPALAEAGPAREKTRRVGGRLRIDPRLAHLPHKGTTVPWQRGVPSETPFSSTEARPLPAAAAP